MKKYAISSLLRFHQDFVTFSELFTWILKLICQNDETVILQGSSFELIEKVNLGLEEKVLGNLDTPSLNMVKETLFGKKG